MCDLEEWFNANGYMQIIEEAYEHPGNYTDIKRQVNVVFQEIIAQYKNKFNVIPNNVAKILNNSCGVGIQNDQYIHYRHVLNGRPIKYWQIEHGLQYARSICDAD